MSQDDDEDKALEKKLNAAMPWIGVYIAAASMICTLAMAADLFNGFRLKKLWFPSKFFSINAASLTVLAVAMKLSVDLNTNLIDSAIDYFAKYMSLIFMVTTLTNFMFSFGSMTDNEVLANGFALAIFVITVGNNVGIQVIELHKDLGDAGVIIVMFPTIFMLILLMIVVSSAVTVPSMKRSLERKYEEKLKLASYRDEAVLLERRTMMKYLVMAETSSPQFVMARSVVCSSAATFLLAALVFLGLYIVQGWLAFDEGKSPYGNTTTWIACIQSIGVVLGSIAPVFRWFVAVSFKCAYCNRNGFKMGINIEDYWTQALVDWRDSFSGLQIRHNKFRKYLHDAKWFILTLLIGVQILVVLISKLNLFLSALFMTPLLNCYIHLKKFVKKTGHDESGGDDDDMIEDLKSYVLRLEGEAELPRSILKNIILQADQLIQKGRKKQPQSLLKLLDKFANLNGLEQFDRVQIPGVHSQEPPNCWRLPVVTLTSIAIAIPNIRKDERKQLLSSVSEGLALAKTVEATLFQNAQLINNRKAADTYWVGVVLYMRWTDTDLREMSRYTKTWNETLQKLSNEADKTVMDFKRQVQDSVFQNPLNWPPKVVAANSMYRVSQTILLSCEEENEHTDEGLFDRLSAIIAHTLAACLKNIPQALTTMCHSNVIEKREKSVREAFHLLGETEQVVELLQQWRSNNFERDETEHIDIVVDL